ncbi:MAG: Fur family transcriptional regulator [Armatimonadota bacterium]|nr:Fur family transcriptional regulator [Armatimonadota bacterium]
MTPPTGDALVAQLRRHRLRLTPQRALICRLLEGNTAHPSAEALHRRAAAEMPTLSLRTVYAILHELEAIGAIRSLDVGTGSVRYDPDPLPHQHAVCARCGVVRDAQATVGAIEWPADNRQGFRVSAVDLIFRGLCEECAR